MKILITGATGYIGQNLIPELIKSYADIEILTINRDAEKARQLFDFAQCKHIAVSEMNEKIAAFNPELVIHLATLSTSRNDDEIIAPMLQANIEFGVRLLSALTRCSALKLFVNLGSFAEYRLGTEKISDAYLYTATKSAFRSFVDYYSNLSGFKYITAVLYTVYGGKDTAKKIIDYIRESLGATEAVKMTAGEQILDFIHVSDVVRFFICAINNIDKIMKMPNGQEFHVGTGVGTSIRELAKIIEKTEGKICNADWGALPYRPLDVMKAMAPARENATAISWKARISVEEGVKINRN